MATANLQTPSRKRYPPKPTGFKFWIAIADDLYSLTPLPRGDAGERVYRFRKFTGERQGSEYDVAFTEHGWSCTCPAGVYYVDKSPLPCRHIKTCAALTREFSGERITAPH